MKTFKPKEEDSIRNRKMSYMKIDQYESQPGLISVIMGIAALVFLIVLCSISYAQKGNSGMWIGVLGILLMIVAISGVGVAIYGLRDEEAKKGRSFVALGINLVAFLILLLLYIYG